MTLEHDEGNGANVFDEGPGENNELNGIDESVNVIVGEDSNNIDEDISESDWVDGDNILSDDDDDELASLKNKFNVVSKKIKNKTITVEDFEPDVALEIIKFSTGLIEEDLGGLGSGEGTEYLDSSDVGSYKTDSDGDVVCKKSGKVFFDASAVEPRFQLGMIFESQQQLKDTLCAYAVAHSFDFRLAREELKVDLHKRTCLKARKWALEKIRGNVVHEFNRLFDYVFALRSADPNGTFDLMVERPTDVATPKFRRLYLKKKAFDDLMEKDPRHWSKAFFSTRSKCDAVDNNYSEAFNSAILGARFKSVILMFEDIRHYVMGRLVEHKKKSISWKGELCPRIEKKLEVHKISSAFCHVIWNGAEGYEVMCHQDTFVVDIKGWSCTCRLWDLTGIPCPHVVCVVLYREERLEDYVLVSYKKHVYIDLYNAAMPTISSEQFWKDTKMGSLDPPLKRKLPGRPKHKRKREEGEVRSGNKWTKRGVKMTCRLCRLNGHNIRTCPNKKQDNVQTEDVQTKSAQSVQSESSSPIPTSAPLTEPQIVGQARTKITSNRTPGMCRAFRYNLHTRAHRYASTTFQPTALSQQRVVVSEPPTTFSQQHTTVSELHAARAPKLIIRRP
ncbi:hypothetical protein V6N13_054204 [Hibiscus sabdariffa]